MKRRIGTVLAGVLVLFGLLQLIRPSIPQKPPAAEIAVPSQIKQILEESCYNCHSDQTRLSWFDEVQPGYSLVRYDVLTARQHLDFSTLGSEPAAVQRAALFEAVSMIQLGAMPLQRYTQLHPEAKVTPEELAILKNYLAPWTTPPPLAATPVSAAAISSTSLATVQAEYNGLVYDPAFKGWKVLSTTDRGDNNTLRFILGNQIAVDAARAGRISPWPDGTRFAKVAWQQVLGQDGLIHPGGFWQVELMVKDAQRYKATDGWGWGRWRGLDLKPYGKDAGFVNECTGCHQPVRGDDYVYTLPITPIQVSRSEVVNSAAAALPPNLPYNPLGWNAITMYVDPQARTVAILYGDDGAIRAVQARKAAATSMTAAYAAGAVLALVTWVQRDDPHWFGARIPAVPQSIEFVRVAGHQADGYRRFAGTGLSEEYSSTGMTAQRTSFILNLTPAQLP
jgi:hypothetical protein